MSKEAMKLAIEALDSMRIVDFSQDNLRGWNKAITSLREALAEQPAQQEPVAYDKTELNCFAQDLYDQKMREGKRGHYESMFHVIHQCVKKVASPPPQRTWVGLTDDERRVCMQSPFITDNYRAIESKLKEKNT